MDEHPSKEELSGFLLGKLAPHTCEAVAEHVVLMQQGQIVADGNPDAVLTDDKLFAAYV